jgi:hypothetical protein
MALAPGLALALIAALGPREGEAAPRAARISWEAPLECPSSSWLSHRVGAYLGHAPEPGVLVAGRVRAKDAGFVLELRTEVAGVREHHRVEHHDCAALVEIAASLAAISIDPLATREEPVEPMSDPRGEPPPGRVWPRPRPETARGREVVVQRPSSLSRVITSAPPAREAAADHSLAEGSATSSSTRESLSSPASALAGSPSDPLLLLDLRPVAADERDAGEPPAAGERRTRLLVSAVGGLALNLFPNPAPQVRGGLGVERGSERFAFRAELGAGAALAGRFRSAEGSAGGNLLAWDVAVRPCAVPRWGIVDLRACAAFGAGQIRARGVGVVDAQRRAHPWLWLAAEAGVGVRVHRTATLAWALVLDLGADFNVYRPNFTVTSPDASYATPIVSGHGRLGVELRFF